jgi:hypothetical protein
MFEPGVEEKLELHRQTRHPSPVEGARGEQLRVTVLDR